MHITMATCKYRGRVVSYGLGPVAMLRLAIVEYCRRHGGQKPWRIELHPAVYADLRSRIESLEHVCYYRETTTFDGVELWVSDRVAEPRLISGDGTVEYV